MDSKASRPGLLEIAHHAGVSAATVSRVLNQSAPVSERVRTRVLNSVAALGYAPAPARSPGRAFPRAVALLIPDILNPFFTEIVRGIQDEANVDGLMTVLLETAEDPEREQLFLRLLNNQPITGIIVCGSRLASDDLVNARTREHLPTVVISRSIHHSNIACIIVDFQNATYRATRHLLDLHHTRIAYLPGPSSSEASRARRRGVEAALAEAGLKLRAEWCPASFPNVDGGFQAMSALLALPIAERPTAVIAYNDMMALGVLHAIRAHHLRVPEDISVVGFDDIAMAAHTNPPLTTIAQPKYQMGRLAMKMLRQMLDGQPPPEDGYTLMESPLIVRESTAPAPTNNS